MKILVLIVLSSLAASACAQSKNLSEWPKLISNPADAKKARALCQTFATSKVVAQQVEAEKCLANVELVGASALRIEKGQGDQAEIYDEFIPAAIDASLAHLNRALQLAPSDLSIHQGRLHVLEISRRYADMAKALDDSCTTYRGKEVPDAWLDYVAELFNSGAFEPALNLSRVLDRHYPDNPSIIGNIGALLSVLKRDNESIPYLQRSVVMAPKDAINAWNLGRAYDFTGEDGLADHWYQTGISLMTNPDQLKQSNCIYAEFVENKLKERKRACALQKVNCDTDKQTACTESSKSTRVKSGTNSASSDSPTGTQHP